LYDPPLKIEIEKKKKKKKITFVATPLLVEVEAARLLLLWVSVGKWVVISGRVAIHLNFKEAETGRSDGQSRFQQDFFRKSREKRFIRVLGRQLGQRLERK
jgi:hypothetical protein